MRDRSTTTADRLGARDPIDRSGRRGASFSDSRSISVHRRGARVLAGAAIVTSGLAVAPITAHASAKAPPFTLRVGVVSPTGAIDGFFGWGQKSGILPKALRKTGVTAITYTAFANGPNLNAALQSGSIDVASMGDLPALEARAQGFPTRVLAISSIGGSTWIIGKKGGPTTLAALSGKTVGSPPGTALYRYTFELLQQNHLLPGVTITPLQTPNGVAALEAGQIDAYSATQPYAAELAAEGYPVIDKESAHPGLLATSEIVTTQTFLAAHPTFARAFQSAYPLVVANINSHTAKFWTWEAQAQSLPVGLAKTSYPVTAFPKTPLTREGVALLTTTLAFAASLKLVTATFDVKSWPITS